MSKYVRCGRVTAQIEKMRGPQGIQGPAGESSQQYAALEQKVLVMTASLKDAIRRIEALEKKVDGA